MIAKKVYNNNIVMAIDEDSNEVILAGKGVAYGLKKGDTIDKHRVEKRFELKKDTRTRFGELIQDIPLDYVIISEEIIAYIKEKSGKKINDSIYVTLTDHIVNSIERIKMGIDFDMTLLVNVKTLYKEEFKLALHAVDMLRDYFKITFSDDEAYFITLHIVNSQFESNMMEMYTITSILENITSIVNQNFDIDIEDNYNYDRFMTHCRFFIQRIINQEHFEQNSALNYTLMESAKEKLPKQMECVNEIATYVEKKYGYVTSEDEKMYLLFHLGRLTE
ncbi:beta-glucoside operon transcriptional antiterminator [Breznakia sp. PF5-3]|uniref:PRD domain-containing protein n=1 Tax=unclassified Breznakia TaxID=2623764 RepID=UPI00240582F9|nr:MULTISPECIES: PRD domain-containing protein [unclassified Breznakia]MDF9824205.1 beta-glucoside operon transcriptional antiterminator [Breznakia sp. PM6-1]MDF9835003.1 beta-glucoside operon transcriptional antiterminator [Breznakia sp. PF5-3]MDF9837248.1 beta-glucoside operon transcriptional antiterminator [Breznakia sp. PFB2-8]MDF9859238.1 beta-glucoside operon transcriptional antiterminator [Breznakia sp. PH5-24]